MKYGSLFSGIGGIDLGLDRAGMECAWQVEVDEWCRDELENGWPGVTRHADVREVGPHNLGPVDLICGGFPCQDISSANPNKEGIQGEQSGLWSEFRRVVRELGPEVVLVENVSDLVVRGLDVVLGDLTALGYDAEWETLPACAFGAPQRRERVFVVAHHRESRRAREAVTYFDGQQLDPAGLVLAQQRASEAAAHLRSMDDGVYDDRYVQALGNAVHPDVAEWIGRRIMAASPPPGRRREVTETFKSWEEVERRYLPKAYEERIRREDPERWVEEFLIKRFREALRREATP